MKRIRRFALSTFIVSFGFAFAVARLAHSDEMDGTTGPVRAQLPPPLPSPTPIPTPQPIPTPTPGPTPPPTPAPPPAPTPGPYDGGR